MSTERLRETIRKEDTLTKNRGRPDEEEVQDASDASLLRASDGLAPQNLYDVVNRVPDVSLKYRRDDRQVGAGDRDGIGLPQYSIALATLS